MRLKKSFKKVAILNPDHFFEQAIRLASPSSVGPPRQVDVRRAISAAYYGVFHAILAAAADQFIGPTRRASSQYGLVYRSVSHDQFRRLCEEIKKSTLSRRYSSHAPANGFGSNIVAFAAAAMELQEKRYSADYDPLIRFKQSDAMLAVQTARAALRRFEKASGNRRRAFLGLLLFAPR
jgi:hypothetical protein